MLVSSANKIHDCHTCKCWPYMQKYETDWDNKLIRMHDCTPFIQNIVLFLVTLNE